MGSADIMTEREVVLPDIEALVPGSINEAGERILEHRLEDGSLVQAHSVEEAISRGCPYLARMAIEAAKNAQAPDDAELIAKYSVRRRPAAAEAKPEPAGPQPGPKTVKESKPAAAVPHETADSAVIAEQPPTESTAAAIGQAAAATVEVQPKEGVAAVQELPSPIAVAITDEVVRDRVIFSEADESRVARHWVEPVPAASEERFDPEPPAEQLDQLARDTPIIMTTELEPAFTQAGAEPAPSLHDASTIDMEPTAGAAITLEASVLPLVIEEPGVEAAYDDALLPAASVEYGVSAAAEVLGDLMPAPAVADEIVVQADSGESEAAILSYEPIDDIDRVLESRAARTAEPLMTEMRRDELEDTYGLETAETYLALAELHSEADETVQPVSAERPYDSAIIAEDEPVMTAEYVPAEMSIVSEPVTPAELNFETLVAELPAPDEYPVLETIRERADDQPLELTLAQLADHLSDSREPSDSRETPDEAELLETVRELAASLAKADPANLTETGRFPMTPEITGKLIAVLRSAGYKNPSEALVNFVRTYDVDMLLQAIGYICRQTPEGRRKEHLAAITAPAAYQPDDDDSRHRLGKLLFGLVSRASLEPAGFSAAA